MKFGILGFGSIGKRHACNLLDLGHQIYVYDPDDGAGRSVESQDDAINKSDAVIIATPTKQHGQDIQDAMAASKHIFVEKPIGYDCPPFIAGLLHGYKIKHPDKVVAVGFNLRFHAAIRHAKELLDEGMIGAVTAATFRVQQKSTKPIYLMDGVVRNWASHEIDIARYLLGDLTYQNCDIDRKDGNDYAAKIFLGAGEAPVVVIADYYTDPEVRTYDIYGRYGIMYVDVVKRTVHVTKNGEVVYEFLGKDTFDDNYKQEMAQFVMACESGQIVGELASGMDGCESLDIVCKALGMDYGEWPRQ